MFEVGPAAQRRLPRVSDAWRGFGIIQPQCRVTLKMHAFLPSSTKDNIELYPRGMADQTMVTKKGCYHAGIEGLTTRGQLGMREPGKLWSDENAPPDQTRFCISEDAQLGKSKREVCFAFSPHINNPELDPSPWGLMEEENRASVCVQSKISGKRHQQFSLLEMDYIYSVLSKWRL